jgi:hypothetical protein
VSVEELSSVICYLRGLPAPCLPPVGVGTFLVLYASEREVVVWYSPARDDHREGEVTIPCYRLARALETLMAGQALDEAALELLGEGLAGGRWLLALLAQVPGVRVQEQPLALVWSPEVPGASQTAPAQAAKSKANRRRAKAGPGVITGARPAKVTKAAAPVTTRSQMS